jgi:UDP-N-acetylglucosamine 2-epimerase
VAACRQLLNQPQTYRKMTLAPNPYGDGRASQRIVHHLRRYLTSIS